MHVVPRPRVSGRLRVDQVAVRIHAQLAVGDIGQIFRELPARAKIGRVHCRHALVGRTEQVMVVRGHLEGVGFERRVHVERHAAASAVAVRVRHIDGQRHVTLGGIALSRGHVDFAVFQRHRAHAINRRRVRAVLSYIRFHAVDRHRVAVRAVHQCIRAHFRLLAGINVRRAVRHRQFGRVVLDIDVQGHFFRYAGDAVHHRHRHAARQRGFVSTCCEAVVGVPRERGCLRVDQITVRIHAQHTVGDCGQTFAREFPLRAKLLGRIHHRHARMARVAQVRIVRDHRDGVVLKRRADDGGVITAEGVRRDSRDGGGRQGSAVTAGIQPVQVVYAVHQVGVAELVITGRAGRRARGGTRGGHEVLIQGGKEFRAGNLRAVHLEGGHAFSGIDGIEIFQLNGRAVIKRQHQVVADAGKRGAAGGKIEHEAGIRRTGNAL